VCALFPVNLLLSQNNNIRLRGLRKSPRRRACALLSVHGAALDIDHILNSEHECTPLRLPRTMASTVIFPYYRARLPSVLTFTRILNHSTRPVPSLHRVSSLIRAPPIGLLTLV
jgi:hypothetical protein